MKSLFYALALVAIGAAGFFGWSAKEKYTQQLADRDELIASNKRLSQNIKDKELEKAEATEAKKIALQSEADAKAGLEAAKAKATEYASTLDSVSGELEVAAARMKEIDDSIEALKGQFPGIELDEVEGIVKDMESKLKKLIAEEEDSMLIKTKLEESVAKNLAENSRVNEKINDSIKRVEGNTFQATITAVDNDWNFVVIGAGEKSGLSGDSKLLVQRNGRLLGKLLISQLEPNSAIANVEPGSLRVGVALRPGDQVILETVRSN